MLAHSFSHLVGVVQRQEMAVKKKKEKRKKTYSEMGQTVHLQTHLRHRLICSYGRKEWPASSHLTASAAAVDVANRVYTHGEEKYTRTTVSLSDCLILYYTDNGTFLIRLIGYHVIASYSSCWTFAHIRLRAFIWKMTVLIYISSTGHEILIVDILIKS